MKQSCFIFDDIPLCLINSLRRIIMCNLKNTAFNEKNITIIKNTSNYTDEIIKRRLSLVPILSLNEDNKIIYAEINLINVQNRQYFVTSDDLLIRHGNCRVFKDIILCQLKPNDEIQLTAKTDIQTTDTGGIFYRVASNVWFRKLQFVYCKEQNTKLLDYFKKCNINLRSTIDMKENNDDEEKYSFYHNIKAKDGYHLLGISENLNKIDTNQLLDYLDINHPNDDEYLLFEDADTIYAFFIESYFPELSGRKILKLGLEQLKQQITNILSIQQQYKIDIAKKTAIFKYNLLTVTEISPLVYYLKKHDEILYAHYDIDHPHSEIIKVFITLNIKIKLTGEEIINKIQKIYKDTIVKFLSILEQLVF